MNIYTYIRNSPFPKCKHCKIQLDFYVPGMADEDHTCDKCMSKDLTDALIKIVKDGFVKAGFIKGIEE